MTDHDLQPGPELDRLVAEKVMGWKKWSTTGDHLWTAADSRVRSLRPEDAWAFNPSTNIAHAWEVVEKLIDKDPNIGIDCDGNWACSLWNHVARADTAPHAICLAALKAVGATHAD